MNKYSGNYKVKNFTCRSQFLCMAFGQLTYRNGLRDIVTCLRAHRNKLYHMGIRGGVSLNNLSNANMQRDWRIYAEFAQVLINIARKLYAGEKFSKEISEPVYALDSTTISISLSLFPWAEFRGTRGGIKLHTIMELPSSIPTFIDITEARPYDVNFLDRLIVEPGAYYVGGEVIVFLTNNFELSALIIADLYKARWKIELFFKWIKQHLRIKRLFGHTINAVKTQIWIAVSVYVLVAIIQKRLDLERYSLYNIL